MFEGDAVASRRKRARALRFGSFAQSRARLSISADDIATGEFAEDAYSCFEAPQAFDGCGGTRMDDSRRRLLWHGMFLFFLGLVTGFVETKFANPRMGLAAHLEGLMNGTFLVALGAIWAEVKLPSRWKTAAFWCALYGTYANWAVTCLAAILGTAALSPITGAGHSGQPWEEKLVTLGFTSVGLVIVAASLSVLRGLRRVAA